MTLKRRSASTHSSALDRSFRQNTKIEERRGEGRNSNLRVITYRDQQVGRYLSQRRPLRNDRDDEQKVSE